MTEHLHELLHVAAATLFIVAGASALLEYRNLRERVVLTFGIMCLCSAGYACHVIVSHNLPKVGEFWVPWTSFGLFMTFGATFFYLVTMQSFVGVRGYLFTGLLVAQGTIVVVALGDLLFYAMSGRSTLFVSVPRTNVGAHQWELGEGAYSLLPTAEVVAGVFMLSFVLGIGCLLVRLVRAGSRDLLVYSGLFVTSGIIVNETLIAMSVFAGVYLLAFSKAIETLRIHHDIRVRARERIEQRLRQAEKLEAVGRVAGGIAHDFNNILAAVGMGVELAEDAIAPDHPAAVDLRTAQDGIRAGRRIVQQLLDVARAREVEPERILVRDFLEDSAKLLSSMVPDGTRLEFKVESAGASVVMSRGRLTQVLMNLVVNAGDAMPNGGTIEVRASSTRPNLGRSRQDGRQPTVVISVADEGSGMPKETLRHVFEPSFSTKLDRGGTGLGLATLHAIVRDAGGHVEVESEVGRGTCFHVFLPCAESSPRRPARPSSGR